MREQVSKIEMYKKSMNNNYRGSVCSGLCDAQDKADFLYSVWSCGVPFFHPCSRFFVILIFFYNASHYLCLGFKRAIFSDDSDDAHNVGNKLGETIEATCSKSTKEVCVSRRNNSYNLRCISVGRRF